MSLRCSRDCNGSTHTTTRGISKLDFSAAPGPKLTGPTDAKGPKPTSPEGATHLTRPNFTCSSSSSSALWLGHCHCSPEPLQG